jgi:hypothetical protein
MLFIFWNNVTHWKSHICWCVSAVSGLCWHTKAPSAWVAEVAATFVFGRAESGNFKGAMAPDGLVCKPGVMEISVYSQSYWMRHTHRSICDYHTMGLILLKILKFMIYFLNLSVKICHSSCHHDCLILHPLLLSVELNERSSLQRQSSHSPWTEWSRFHQENPSNWIVTFLCKWDETPTFLTLKKIKNKRRLMRSPCCLCMPPYFFVLYAVRIVSKRLTISPCCLSLCPL